MKNIKRVNRLITARDNKIQVMLDNEEYLTFDSFKDLESWSNAEYDLSDPLIKLGYEKHIKYGYIEYVTKTTEIIFHITTDIRENFRCLESRTRPNAVGEVTPQVLSRRELEACLEVIKGLN